MSLLAISEDLIEKIKVEAPEYKERVYLMVSREAYLFANIHADPSVVVVYKSTLDGKRAKGSGKRTHSHRFEVSIFQSIWKEAAVVLDRDRGLFKLREDLIPKLDGVRAGFSDRITDIWVSNLQGTQDYQAVDGQSLYKSSISFDLNVMEEL